MAAKSAAVISVGALAAEASQGAHARGAPLVSITASGAANVAAVDNGWALSTRARTCTSICCPGTANYGALLFK